MKSVMSHKFSEVPHANINRSSFDRSHGHKTTFDAGKLIPILVDEALPGDTFNLNMDGFARMATPIFPLMDNAYMDTHFFAVPMRLLWDNWEKFNGAQDKPGDTTDYLIPQITVPSGGWAVQSLADYMGCPTNINSLTHSSLWLRAYNLIYNEWYRDENLQDPVTVYTHDGPDDPHAFRVMRRGKRHDYFTSCMPFPQKGPESNIPLTGDIPVEYKVNGTAVTLRRSDTGARYPQNTIKTLEYNNNSNLSPQDSWSAIIDPNGTLTANLASASAVSVNILREAFAIQHILEKNARAGTRYTEIVKSHFGVTSPDSRLQRPEYLGGGSSPVIITPIEQTSSTDTTSPQGNLAAYGTTELRNHGFTKSFTEHSVIIGLVSVRADLTYQQGLDRMWSRKSRYDFYWPALANLGEQAVLNKEIYAQGIQSTDNEVFGYQERWAEYRYKPSKITGQFRSTYSASLDPWHLSQEFKSLPTLASSFIEENPPFDRVIAVPSEPHFIFDSFFRMKCARPMPTYSIPGLDKL